MEQNNAIWTSLLKTVLDMPGIRVNRDEFLKDKLEKFCPSDKLELAVENPVKMVSKNILDKIANTSINRHTTKVTSLSAATGIIADTALDNSVNAIALGVTGISNNGVPIEMAKFYWHALTLSQKLAYLYGFPPANIRCWETRKPFLDGLQITKKERNLLLPISYWLLRHTATRNHRSGHIIQEKYTPTKRRI